MSRTTEWPVCGLAAPEELAGHPDRLLTNGPGVPVVPCGENALAFASFACVHEHIRVVDICGACDPELLQAAARYVMDAHWHPPLETLIGRTVA